jgi:hypothetical protein
MGAMESCGRQRLLGLSSSKRVLCFVIERRSPSVDHTTKQPPRQKIVDRFTEVKLTAGLDNPCNLGKKASTVVDVMNAA